MLQVVTGGLTLCPQFIVQALQGVGRVPFLQGEPSKHSASHRELHLSTVTHPILYLKQKSLSFRLALSRFYLPLHLLMMWTCISYAWLSAFVWMDGNERGLRAWAKEGGENGKERGRCDACSSRLEKGGSTIFSLQASLWGLTGGKRSRRLAHKRESGKEGGA